MEPDIWVVKLRDYRKWVIHIYVELYKGNDPYRTVYFDYHKSKWCYAKNESNKNGVDFNELEKFLKPVIIDEYVRKSNSISFIRENVDSMKFIELLNYVCYSMYFNHPKYKSAHNLNNERDKERQRELLELRKEHRRKWNQEKYSIKTED